MTKEELFNMPKTECACERCQTMCKERTCWGTPEEIRKLIELGYAKSLWLDYWAANNTIYIVSPAAEGYGGDSAPFWPSGRCVLLTENNKCSIYNMRPLEAAITDHRKDPLQDKIHGAIAKLWKTKEGKEVVKLWEREVNYGRGR